MKNITLSTDEQLILQSQLQKQRAELDALMNKLDQHHSGGPYTKE